MPELPEVETIRRDLADNLLNLKIQEIQVLDSRVLRNCTKAEFIRRCTSKTIFQVFRRGKALVIQLKPAGYLVIQPMMTGHLIFFPSPTHAVLNDTKIVFTLSNQSRLNYNDQRLFGRIQFVENLQEVSFFRHLGPDPFDAVFTVDWLRANLKKRKGPIKPLLMNQNFIAGIGNIYASEILFQSAISPKQSACKINREKIQRLHQAVIDILQEAVSLRGTSMRNYRDLSGVQGNFKNRIKVYGRAQEQCPQCASTIVKIVQAGRSTFFCRKCQK